MVALPDNPRWTEAEYLAFERSSQERHEFIDGYVVAMAGASPEHDLIMTNTLASLHSQLIGRPCRVFSPDIKVRVAHSKLYTYPDIKVVCGAAIFADDQKDALLNPNVIIEVLSDSTEAYDRGDKFIQYRKLESLQEYLLISQKRVQIERWVRQLDNRWLLADEVQAADGSLELTSVGCTLAMADVYHKMEFEDNSSDKTTET
jgi:Uma2 family endonuclease